MDFHGMRLFTDSLTKDGLVDKRTATDREHNGQDVFIDGLIMEEIHGQNEERLNLMPSANMCDSEEEKQLMESIVGVDDVSGEPKDQSSVAKARRTDSKNAEFIIILYEKSLKPIQKESLSACVGLMSTRVRRRCRK